MAISENETKVIEAKHILSDIENLKVGDRVSFVTANGSVYTLKITRLPDELERFSQIRAKLVGQTPNGNPSALNHEGFFYLSSKGDGLCFNWHDEEKGWICFSTSALERAYLDNPHTPTEEAEAFNDRIKEILLSEDISD